jgi:hypothetical protein
MSAERSPAPSSPSTTTSTTAVNSVRRRGRRGRPSSPPRAAASLEAKRRAAAILEVLAGSRRPSEAAAALGVTVPRYYFLEERALRGLVAACEPASTSGPRWETRLAQLEKQLAQAQRECARQHALVRVAQRSVGLAAPPTAKSVPAGKTAGNAAKNSKSRRSRRPTVRALKAARTLLADSSGPTSTEALQPDEAMRVRSAELPAGPGKEA